MLGLSKGFVVALILGGIVGYETHNFINFISVVGVYAIGRIIWNIFT